MGVRRRAQRVTGGGSGGAMDVAPTPKGSTRATDTHPTVVGSPTPIVSYTVPDGKTFALSKILVTWAGEDEQKIVVKVDSEVVGTYFSTAYVMDWFPPGVSLVGDGIKTVVIEAEAVTVIAALTGYIEGELT